MFKYIKKLTSVVVMFAVIIVFSPSKVYAEHSYEEASKRALSVFYGFTILTSNYGLDLDDATSILTAEIEEISRSKEPESILDLNAMLTGIISIGISFGDIRQDVDDDVKTPFRSTEIKLSQEDMREYFDSKYNKKTKLYELTEKGKKDFEKAKEKRREGDGGGGGGGGGGC